MSNGYVAGLAIAEMFYASWYKQEVSPNLSKEQKQALLKKLSDLSLERAFWVEDSISKDEFPELKPFSHTSAFSGTQLYVVMSEVFNEVSPVKIETPYPHLPERKEKPDYDEKVSETYTDGKGNVRDGWGRKVK